MFRKAIATMLVLAVVAPAAVEASSSLGVTPRSARPGWVVRVFGSVYGGCPRGEEVLLYSRAFAGATREEFAGVPAVYAMVHGNYEFSTKVTLSRALRPGRYEIGGRCGGGRFGEAWLRVRPRRR